MSARTTRPVVAIPDQTGRTALVTGATGGLGLRVAEVLASHGARVFLGSRNPERGSAALARVAAAASPSAPAPQLVDLDLSDLGSVRAAAADIRSRTGDRLDLLVNNGGIMAPPLSYSRDGFELQWATNVIGPAALTWQLLPAIEAVAGSRVVFVSSNRHFKGNFDETLLRSDVRGEAYRGFDVYGRTKLADLLVSYELQRHFDRAGASSLSVAAHPGFTATSIVGSGFASLPPFAHRIATAAVGVLGQPVEVGALPILHAAVAPGVTGSQFFGPTNFFELRGPPGIAARSAASTDDALGGMLLRCLEELTGLSAPR
jgi:protochlorophyllide reductase